MSPRNLLPRTRPRRARRARGEPARRAALSLLAFAALIVSVLVAGLGAAAPKAAAATCGTTNVALNKTATASSTENAGTPAADAVDGNTGNAWSSAFSDPQWLEVDLGSSQSICGVSLNWEAAYATAFQIQTSTDNVELDEHLLHHHRHRRRAEPHGLRHRPLHPHVRHRPRHPVRLLDLGVPGLRHRGQQRDLRHDQRGAEPDDDRLLDRERGHSRGRRH